MQGDRERCLASGMDDYLAKPVRLPQLKATLERCTMRLSGRDLMEPPPLPPRPGFAA